MSLIENVNENNLNETKRLIQNGANVNVENEYGRTALWCAASLGHVECATALLDAKAEVDKASGSSTPLHTASSYGRAECVRVRSFVRPYGGDFC
jgi:ankyrin repeat protein